MSVGTVLPAALTVPIAQSAGDWRVGLGIWALAALVSAVFWLLLVRGDRPTRQGETQRAGVNVARSPLAWSLALFMGLQALQAYAMFGWLPQIFRDAGLDAAHAGFLFSVIPLVGIPLSLVLPGIAVKLGNQSALVVAFVALYVAGYLGLWLAPAHLPLLWVTMIGIGMGAFPLALTMIGLRSRESDVTARLSGFVQSIGYLVAAAGPLAIGALYGATGGWTVPIWVLLLLLVPQLILGLLASRQRYVDDEIAIRA
jgi:CP family cyanate transporter-like MFS transporter